MQSNRPSIFLAIPSGDNVSTDFALSLTALTVATRADFCLGNIRTSCLAQSRELLAERAIESGCEYTLWLDSDMEFPARSLNILLETGVDMIGVDYPKRESPGGSTVVWKDGKVTRMGFGLVLMKTEILSKIQVPRFPILWDGKTKSYRTEDYTFCEKVLDAGIRIYCHTELSKHIGHAAQRILRVK